MKAQPVLLGMHKHKACPPFPEPPAVNSPPVSSFWIKLCRAHLSKTWDLLRALSRFCNTAAGRIYMVFNFKGSQKLDRRPGTACPILLLGVCIKSWCDGSSPAIYCLSAPLKHPAWKGGCTLQTHTHPPFQPNWSYCSSLISLNKEPLIIAPHLYIIWHFDKAELPALLSFCWDPPSTIYVTVVTLA